MATNGLRPLLRARRVLTCTVEPARSECSRVSGEVEERVGRFLKIALRLRFATLRVSETKTNTDKMIREKKGGIVRSALLLRHLFRAAIQRKHIQHAAFIGVFAKL